jgi:hypothetical protein
MIFALRDPKPWPAVAGPVFPVDGGPLSRPRPSNPGSARRARPERVATRRAHRAPGALGAPPPGLAVALAVMGLLLLAAPPASNYFWGVNGLRSLPGPEALALLLAAVATALAAFASRGSRVWAALIAVTVAVVVAFPLRESIHFLGDTQLRLRSISAFDAGIVETPFGEWAGRLHANPLDIVVNLMAPVALQRAGWPLRDAISTLCAALALLYFVGLWRITGRLGVATGLRLPIGLALGLTGVLEAFAGYAESAGLLAVTTAWWWAEALTPLSGARQALRLTLAWLVVGLSHRLGVVLLLPMLWRALGPGWEGDRPGPRRLLLGITLALATLGAAALGLTTVGQLSLTDLHEMVGTLRSFGFRYVAPTDWINTLALLAPWALILPFFAGREALSACHRRPVFGLGMSVAIPLLFALVLLLPVGASGLGAQRDWDLNVILSITLTVTAGALAAALPTAALRVRLAWTLPVLALVSLGFVAVQASEPAAERRALAVASQPPRMPGSQVSHAFMFLGQRAMDHGQARMGAQYFDRAFDLNRNPRRALLAAEAWAASGDFAAARRALQRARAGGALGPELERAARRIEDMLAKIASEPTGGVEDSTAGGR